LNVAGAPALTEKLAAAAALMNSKPCVSIVIGLLNRGNDEVPGGAIVKLGSQADRGTGIAVGHGLRERRAKFGFRPGSVLPG
jgi:hypothetical protein